jgi:GT2 family glycosyltransferase
LAQDCGFPFEIIVHDDASTDGSAQYIRDKYPEIRLLESRENVGFCVANNRMAASAKGEYLLLLNNDASLFFDALKALLSEAERLNRPAILGLPQYDAASGELVDIGSLFDPFLNPVPNLNPLRGEVGMVIGACLWIPKCLWDELGGFPEWFGSIAEDMYLCCYARLAGYAVRASPVSGYRHWQGKSFGGNRVAGNRLSTTYRRRALSERNKSFVMALTYPAPFMQLLLPLHLALLLMEGALLAMLRGRLAFLTKIYLPVFAALFRQRKALRTGRAAIKKKCRLANSNFFSVFDPWPYKLKMLFRHGLPVIKE